MRRILASLSAALALALLAGSAHAASDGDATKQKATGHKATQSKDWVDLDPPFSMAVISDQHVTGILLVWVGLDIHDDALRDAATHSLPVLRDAYLRNLMAFTATSVRLDTQPDVGVIADRLQAVTDRALGRHGARILLRQVALRAK